jgi:DNA-binding MarR family transcriptional regulator
MSASRRYRLYHRLQLAAHRLRRVADRAVSAEVGLTTAQTSVLSVLVQDGRASQREVARQLGVSEAAVTPMSRRLIAMGLVERSPDERDGRAWVLRISESGRQKLRRASARFGAVNRVLDAELSEAEVRSLVDCLDRVIATLE